MPAPSLHSGYSVVLATSLRRSSVVRSCLYSGLAIEAVATSLEKKAKALRTVYIPPSHKSSRLGEVSHRLFLEIKDVIPKNLFFVGETHI